MKIQELDNDQRREMINSRQRHDAWAKARSLVNEYRGSMVWHEVNGETYLVRSAYNKLGVRRQVSLGPRNEETKKKKADFEVGREKAKARYYELNEARKRQGAINRALGLGRVPLIGAEILRALDDAGTLGTGLRVVGTNAIFAYEAGAGVMVDPGLTATGDIDFLMDARGGLRFVLSEEVSERSLISVLRSVDKTFEASPRSYRAENADGYMVDLIKPMRNPPRKREVTSSTIGLAGNDLTAAAIEGLVWLENAPAFESIAIDERGFPVRIVAPDPRVWAAHKLWISGQPQRDPLKRERDRQQASVVAAIVEEHFPHLPFQAEELKMLPQGIIDAAEPLFSARRGGFVP